MSPSTQCSPRAVFSPQPSNIPPMLADALPPTVLAPHASRSTLSDTPAFHAQRLFVCSCSVQSGLRQPPLSSFVVTWKVILVRLFQLRFRHLRLDLPALLQDHLSHRSPRKFSCPAPLLRSHPRPRPYLKFEHASHGPTLYALSSIAHQRCQAYELTVIRAILLTNFITVLTLVLLLLRPPAPTLSRQPCPSFQQTVRLLPTVPRMKPATMPRSPLPPTTHR